MRKILTLFTVISGFIALSQSGFAQERYRHDVVNNTFDVDYRHIPEGVPNVYTDEQGAANPYNDNSTISTTTFNPIGVGTAVKLEFNAVDIEAGDELEIFIGASQGLVTAPSTFVANAGNRSIDAMWTEDGGTPAQGWEATMSLVNDAGDDIPFNYQWNGIAEGGNLSTFLFNPGQPDEAFVFCGFEADVRFILEDRVENTTFFGFNEMFGSYEQRLDSIYVDWGDGTTYANQLGQGFEIPDPAAHRATYESTNPRTVVFGNGAAGVQHPYATPGRYSVEIVGVDELGVRSNVASVDVIIEGNFPTSAPYTGGDQEVCFGDPTTLEFTPEWLVSNYNSRVVAQRWEGVAPGGNPGDAQVTLSNDAFLNIGPAAYDTDPTPGDADLTDGRRDYTFTYYATFDNQCQEFDTTITYTVYKIPDAGEPNPATDNTICETETSFDLATLLQNQDSELAGGQWFDGMGNPISNIVNPSALGVGTFTYTYRVSNPKCPSDEESVNLIVTRAPYAGVNDPLIAGTVSNPQKLCVTETNFDLYTLIDGGPSATPPTPAQPDIDGFWYLDNDPNNVIQNPRINGDRFLDASQWGVVAPEANRTLRLTYRVDDETGNCDPDETTIFVRLFAEVVAEPSMIDTSVCEDDPVIELDGLVETAFRNSGNWFQTGGPVTLGAPAPAFFNPGTVTTEGVYEFTKTVRNQDNNGNDICVTKDIVVTINFFLKPVAGPDQTLDVCPDGIKDLYSFLATGASTDGIWFGPDNPTSAITVNDAMNYDFSGDQGNTVTFRYEVRGEPGICPDDEAIYTFNIGTFSNAGVDTTFLVCTSDADFTLFDRLGGAPDAGGTWSPSTGISTPPDETATFSPAANDAGSYTYTYAFADMGICPAVDATINMTVFNQPLSGDDVTTTICNVDDNQDPYMYDLSENIIGGANGNIYGAPTVAMDVNEEFGSLDPTANGFTNPTTGMVDVNTLGGNFATGGNTYTFFYRTFNDGCDADTAFFEITINNVGRAGIDSLVVRCATEPAVDLADYLGSNVDDFGMWEDVDGTNTITNPMNFFAQLNPGLISPNLHSPDTGFRMIYTVEVDECPTDSANLVAYISDAPKGGIRKLGDDSLLRACEDETALQLTDGFVDDSYTEPMGNGGRLNGQWKLRVPFLGYLVPQSLIDDVNNPATRPNYFKGADSSQFDVANFIREFELRNNTNLYDWYKTDRLLYFEYTAMDTSAGKLVLPEYYEGNGPIGRDINCADSSSIMIAAVMPKYEDRFTFNATAPGAITVCESIEDFDLKFYFQELNSVQGQLDILDIYNPVFDTLSFEGIDANGNVYENVVYNNDPSFGLDAYKLNISEMAATVPAPPLTGTAYSIRMRMAPIAPNTECPEYQTDVPLQLQVERVPNPGGFPTPGNQLNVSQFSICEGSANFDLYGVVENDPDAFQNPHRFTANSPGATVLGRNFSMAGTGPGLYEVVYSIPTEACVSPITRSINDPANTDGSRPKRFSSLIEITVTSAPDLDGFDQQLNEYEVCTNPEFLLKDLFPGGNTINTNGTWSKISGNGTVQFPDNFDGAIYDYDETQPGVTTVLLRYTVEEGNCPPVFFDVRLNLNIRPFPGTTARDTVCLDNGLVDLFTILNRQTPPAVNRDGVFEGVSGGNANNALVTGGFFDPTVSGVGTHRIKYTVGDGVICDKDSAFVTLVVQRIRRTGTNGTINACIGDDPISLFDGLNGFFDVGGVWIEPNPTVGMYMLTADSSVFDHVNYLLDGNTGSQFNFRYVIRSQCATDTSVVTVFITPGPASGRGDTTVNVCKDLPSYDLFEALGIFADKDYILGGTWRGLNGAPAPFYSPGNSTAVIRPNMINQGTYRYRYEVEADCGDTTLSSATIVTVVIGDNLSAGLDSTVSICYDGRQNLNTLFGRAPGEGVWSVAPGSQGGLTDGVFFDTNFVTASPLADEYAFNYTVPETFENCGPTTATYTIDLRIRPQAGIDTTIFTCTDGASIDVLNDMFPGYVADARQTFTYEGNGAVAISGDVFFPNQLDPGNYEITLVVSDSKCDDDEATANIFIEDGDDSDSFYCGDIDLDGVDNLLDLDVDGDGLSNSVESRFNGSDNDPFGNHDNDALLNFQDPDYATLIGSFIETGVVAAFDADGDGVINALDLDSDNDLIPDVVEGFGVTTANAVDRNPRDGRTDSDLPRANGINNSTLGLTNSGQAPLMTTSPADFMNVDSDGDGIGDIMEGRDHANYNNTTAFVYNPFDADFDGTPDYRDLDSDGDGISDSFENLGGNLTTVVNFDENASVMNVFTRDDVPNFRDTDADGDGIADATEAYLVIGIPNDFDGDNAPNFLDWDSDNDGISDNIEKGPIEVPVNTDTDQISAFSVSDTLPDFIDFDADGDGILDAIEKGDISVLGDLPVNTDASNALGSGLVQDGTPDYIDLDSDGDRIPDQLEQGSDLTSARDTDNDGTFDFQSTDSDGDRYLDIWEANGDTTFAASAVITSFTDFDLDGIPDYLDFDSDDDGIADFYEVVDNNGLIDRVPFDADQDGMPDFYDQDSDEDGLLDTQERGVGNEGSQTPPRDSDEDGVSDFRSIDADGDGVIDRLEGDGDCDGDGIENYRDNGDNCKIEPFVPEAFSPNGDRVNDFFVIPDAQFFPGNKLQVYNRWGALVFEKENYLNTWDGTNDGDVLPDGTYFYTFDLGIGQEALTGFVYIARN